MRILLIEDDDGFGILFKRFLAPYSSEILQVKTITEAWHLANERTFDVLIVDLRLQDSDREKTLGMLPEFRRLQPDAAIIVCSGDITMTTEIALESGADLYLPKSSLLDRMDRALIAAISSAVIPKPKTNRTPTYEQHISMIETVAHAC